MFWGYAVRWLSNLFLPRLGGLSGGEVHFKRWNLLTGADDCRNLLPNLILGQGAIDCTFGGNFVGYSNNVVVLFMPDRDTHWGELEGFWEGFKNAALERNLQVFVTTVRRDSVVCFEKVFGADARILGVVRSGFNSNYGSIVITPELVLPREF